MRRFHGRASRLGGPGAEKVKRRRGGGRAEEGGDMEGGDAEAEGDRRTPVDLQDIVEKLNNAIKDARIKNNLKLDQLSPVHDKLGARNEEN